MLLRAQARAMLMMLERGITNVGIATMIQNANIR